MLAQYFIHYLLNNGILTSSQVLEVMAYERSIHVKLGVLAMDAGFMTAAAVEEIHNLQRSRDQQFGALAVEKGYLSDGQLAGLLSTQGEGYLKVVQAIADKGFLTLGQLAASLAKFRREYAINDEKWYTRQGLDTDTLTRIMVNFSTAGGQAERYYDYIALLLRNIVRFLNDEPFIIGAQPVRVPREDEWVVTQAMVGSLNVTAGLLMDEAVLLEAARRFSGEELTGIDELALDSAGEFLNIHNGVFAGNLSARGLTVDLLPQRVGRTVPQEAAAAGYSISLGLSFGCLNVLLFSEAVFAPDMEKAWQEPLCLRR